MDRTDRPCADCPMRDASTGPRVDLNTNTFLALGQLYQVTPGEAEFLTALCQAYPRTATYPRIITAIWGQQDEPEGAVKIVAVHVNRLRRFISDVARIEAVTNVGYRLVLNTSAIPVRIRPTKEGK